MVMYPTQQVAYSLNISTKRNHPQHYHYHAAAKTSDNTFFYIGNQEILVHSMHSRQWHIQQRRQQKTTINTSSTSTMHSSSIRFGLASLPTSGHTVLWIDNALVSFFGKPNQQPITIIDVHSLSIGSSSSSSSSSSPLHRYAHTTTLIQHENKKHQVYLIGGSTLENDTPQSDIWRLDWETKVWTNLMVDSFKLGIMGHVSLAISRPQSMNILTCFGGDHRQDAFYRHCTLFNTNTLDLKRLEHATTTTPLPRLHASLISVNDTHAVLYGGLSSNSTLLGDLWWLDLAGLTDNKITFTPLTQSIPRAGHVALMLTQSIMLVDGGDHTASSEYNTAIIDLTTKRTDRQFNGIRRYQKRHLVQRSSVQGFSGNMDDESSSGIGGGVIGAIIVAVLFALCGGILLIVLYQRRQRNYNLRSRAIRFSLSTPSQPSESYIEQRSIQQPEPARTRLSLMSTHSELDGSSNQATKLDRYENDGHPIMLNSPSRQLYANWVCETPIPPASRTSKHVITSSTSCNNFSSMDPRHHSTFINQSTQAAVDHDEDRDDDNGGKKRSSTTFQRLRLSIFRPLDIGPLILEHHTQSRPTSLTDDTKQRSSMFGLSRFLLSLGEPSSSNDRAQQTNLDIYPRASLGSRSVASLQWVEFNNDMDSVEGMHPRHLAVMNHRQSTATISSSLGISGDNISRPTSPRHIPQHNVLQPSHPSYRLSHRELRTWNEARLSWLGASSRRLATRDPSKTNSFPNLAHITNRLE
ncbi:hypothetical protein BC941DRAFT_473407 [Chlamydoabsidia padenii]|nr:hypothetical protein BC941DRAFT_473407 [Chlamydoabsidia padenii]